MQQSLKEFKIKWLSDPVINFYYFSNLLLFHFSCTIQSTKYYAEAIRFLLPQPNCISVAHLNSTARDGTRWKNSPSIIYFRRIPVGGLLCYPDARAAGWSKTVVTLAEIMARRKRLRFFFIGRCSWWFDISFDARWREEVLRQVSWTELRSTKLKRESKWIDVYIVLLFKLCKQ